MRIAKINKNTAFIFNNRRVYKIDAIDSIYCSDCYFYCYSTRYDKTYCIEISYHRVGMHEHTYRKCMAYAVFMRNNGCRKVIRDLKKMKLSLYLFRYIRRLKLEDINEKSSLWEV